MTEKSQRDRADRLARAYIIMCNYAFGKTKDVFPLVMDAHTSISMEDLGPVREATFAEIDACKDIVLYAGDGWDDDDDD